MPKKPATPVVPDDPTLEEIGLSPGTFDILAGAAIAVFALLLLIGVLTFSIPMIPFFNLGGAFIVLALLFAASAITTIRTDEWAGFYFFGRALKLARPGPHITFPGLVQTVRAIPRSMKQIQCPGEPEDVYHGDEKSDIPDDMVWPIRVTTRGPTEDETGILDVQMTIEWSFYVQFQILDFFMFVSNVGSFELAKQLIRDSGEKVLKEFASERTLRGVIEDLAIVDDALDNRIRELANRWGMQIFEANTLAPNISHPLAEELRNLPVANLKAEQVRLAAAGELVRLTMEGEGVAAATLARLTSEATGRQLFLEGEAAGLKAKKKALGISGDSILAGEVASDAFKDANAVLMGGSGVADLFATVEATKKVMNEGKKE